jgi:hypothetical protein
VYRLRKAVLAIERVDGKAGVISVPEGAVIRIDPDSTPNDPRMTNVHWREKRLSIFGVDIEERGEEIIRCRDGEGSTGARKQSAAGG